MKRGYTLLELSVVVVLLAGIWGALLPVFRGYRDRWAVLAAREDLVGLLTEARGVAIARGAAAVVVEGPPWRARITVGDSVGRRVDFAARGVSVLLNPPAPRTTVAYNALGLGVFAGRTFRFVAEGRTAALTVSAYGRLRRW